eukprot:9472509-Pyramimonas_sp.AAC.1
MNERIYNTSPLFRTVMGTPSSAETRKLLMLDARNKHRPGAAPLTPTPPPRPLRPRLFSFNTDHLLVYTPVRKFHF